MSTKGRPVEQLSDEELEAQGTQAHSTRNYIFLHGTAEQFANHTVRMLALEQEYLRRHPKRTWQGSGGAPAKTGHPDGEVVGDPIRCVLTKVAEHGGTMHKLELHQAARECGMTREVLATLYNADNQLLRAERSDRVLTADGRDFIARDSGPG